MKRRLRSRACACLACVGLLAGSAEALAKDPGPPGGISAVDQYRETIPTTGGSVPTGTSSAPERPLPPRERKRIEDEGGPDAPALEQIVTSPALGAPQRPLPPLRPIRPRSPGFGDALAAAPTALAGGSGADRLLGLMVAMGATAAAALLVRARRGQ